jgi:hypothetical protein
MTEDRLSYYRHLVTVMGRTRAARFGAADALQKKERISVSVVAFLSIYLLGWSVLSLSYPEWLTPDHSRFYTVVSVVSAAAILAITLMDQSFQRALKAEKFQANALQVSLLMRELERELVEPQPDFTRMSELASRYENYILQTAINHSPMDHLKAQLDHQSSEKPLVNFALSLRASLFGIWFYLSSMWIYFAVVVIVVVSTAAYTFLVVA